MLKSFQGFQPRHAFISVVTGIILWIPAFFFDPSDILIPGFIQSPLLTILHVEFSPGPVLFILLSFLFWSLPGYLLLWLNRKFLFLETRTFLPFLFILIIPPLTGYRFMATSPVLTIPFLLLALEKIISSYRKNGVDYSFFLAGFWAGISSLVWIHATGFMLVVFAGLIIFRSFNFKEWLVSILGFLTPWYFLAGIYFLLNLELESFITLIQKSYYDLPLSTLSDNFLFLTPLIFMALILLVSSFHMLSAFSMLRLKNRKVLQLFFWTFCILLAFVMIYPGQYLYYVPVILIPASVPVSKYFSGRFRRVKSILFDLILLLSLVIAVYRAVG